MYLFWLHKTAPIPTHGCQKGCNGCYLELESESHNVAHNIIAPKKRIGSRTIEFFTIGVSVRLSDRSLHREEQKNFVKNCPQWGLKPGPLDLQANALPTELGRNLLVRRFLK